MFRLDSKPIQMLGRIVDLIVLNLLTVLCSMPLFTIGAAKSALLYCLKQMRLELDHHLIRMYLKRFVSELKKSTALWLIYVAVAGWMIVDIRAMFLFDLGTAGFLLMAVFAVILVMMSIAYLIGMGLNCFFENSVKKMYVNGLLIGMGHFPAGFFLVILEVFPLLLIWFIPQTIGYVVIVYSMIGLSAVHSVELTIYRQIFRKYLPEDTVPAAEEDDYEYDEEEEEKARFDFRSLTDIAGQDLSGISSEDQERS